MGLWCVSVNHHMLTLLLEPATLLNETHEGGDASAGPDHDDWVAGLEGQPELGLAHVHGHGGFVAVVSGQLALQPVGGHTLVGATRAGFILYHHTADVDAVGVHLSTEGASELWLQTDRGRWLSNYYSHILLQNNQ